MSDPEVLQVLQLAKAESQATTNVICQAIDICNAGGGGLEALMSAAKQCSKATLDTIKDVLEQLAPEEPPAA